MLVAWRLAGLSALGAHYVGIVAVTQSGVVDDGVAQPHGSLTGGSERPPRPSRGCPRGRKAAHGLPFGSGERGGRPDS
jgi:hypothetical protein